MARRAAEKAGMHQRILEHPGDWSPGGPNKWYVNVRTVSRDAKPLLYARAVFPWKREDHLTPYAVRPHASNGRPRFQSRLRAAPKRPAIESNLVISPDSSMWVGDQIQEPPDVEDATLDPRPSAAARFPLQNDYPPETVDRDRPIQSLVVNRLPFVLLPPGTWDIQQVIDHYRRLAQNLSTDLKGRKIDWSRLEDIKSLRPVGCHIGEDSWLGYVVFEFAGTDHVVLECPIKDNATYILPGDWKDMVGHTKREIRREAAGRYRS